MEFNYYTINKLGFISGSFEILENERPIYKVNRKGIFSISFIICNRKGEPILTIRKVSAFFKMAFEIVQDGRILATVTNLNKLLKQELTVESREGPLNITGNFSRREYAVSKNDTEIAKVSRKVFKRKNYIGVAIKQSENNLLMLGIVMAIEFKIQIKNAMAG